MFVPLWYGLTASGLQGPDSEEATKGLNPRAGADHPRTQAVPGATYCTMFAEVLRHTYLFVSVAPLKSSSMGAAVPVIFTWLKVPDALLLCPSLDRKSVVWGRRVVLVGA